MKSKKTIIISIIGGLLIVLAIIGILLFNSSAYRLSRALRLGVSSMEEKDWDQAIVAFEKALEIDSNDLDTFEDLINSLIGKIEKAIEKKEYPVAKEALDEAYDWTDTAIKKAERTDIDFTVGKTHYENEAATAESFDELKKKLDQLRDVIIVHDLNGGSELTEDGLGDNEEDNLQDAESKKNEADNNSDLVVNTLEELEEALAFSFATGPIPYIRSHTIMGELYAPYIASYEENISRFEENVSHDDAERILVIYRKLYIMYSESGYMDKAVDVYHKFMSLASEQGIEKEWSPGWTYDEYGRNIDGYGTHLEYGDIEKPIVISNDGTSYMEYDGDGRLIHSYNEYTDATFEYDGFSCTETSIMFGTEVSTTTIAVYVIDPTTGGVTETSRETIYN